MGFVRAVSAAHAVIEIGSAFVPDDLAANYRRVGKELAHPTGFGNSSTSGHSPFS